MIEHGKIIAWANKHNGTAFRIVVSAPINIGQTPYVMGVMLQRDNQNQRLYIHDVVVEEKVSLSSQDDLDTTGSSENGGNLFLTSILKKALDVKEKLTATTYSITDNTGKQLTQEQADFFQDSKVRDENGNLLTVYHGTENGGFTIFNPKRSDDGISLFFTDNPDVAYTYSGVDAPIDTSKVKGRSEWARQRGRGKAGQYPVYLNITNPLTVDGQGATWDTIPFNGTEQSTREIAQYAKENGYDGVIFKNIYDLGGHNNPAVYGEALSSTAYVAFDSNQVKSVDNVKPTADKDIRYSLSNPGDIDPTYGNYNVRGEDVALETGENVAPIGDGVQDAPVAEKTQGIDASKKLLQTDTDSAILAQEATEQSLTYREEGAILAYKSGESYTINSKLRDGAALSSHEQDIVGGMDSALEKLPVYQGKVYRNVVFDGLGDQAAVDELLQRYVVGGTVWHSDYTSTSSDPDGYPVEGQYVVHYEIESANGRDLLGYGNNAESEVLIPRNAEFFVEDIRYDEKGTPTIYLTEMARDEEGVNPGGSGRGAEAQGVYDRGGGTDRSGDYPSGQDVRLRKSETADMQRLPAFQDHSEGDKVLGQMRPESKPGESRGNGQVRGLSDEARQAGTEQIAPIRETPSSDGVFFDGDIAPMRQATAQILTEEPQAKAKKPGAWSWVKEHIFDRGMVFENLALKTGNRELQARWNSIRRADGIAQKLIGEGNANVRSLKSMQEAIQKTGKTKSFYEYLYHLHNVDRMTLAERYDDVENKTVFGDAVTADVSRETAAKLEKANPEFKQYAKDVYAYNTYLRELLVEGGVISRETAKLWEEMYPHYVPIRRAGDTGLNVNVPLDSSRTGINAPIKRATGGNSDILPLFDTMAMRTMQTYKAIAKNRFGVELKNTLGTTVENRAAGLDEVIDSIDTQEALLQEGKNGKKPTFTVFDNGERVKFEITEEMYEAMKPSNFGYTNKTVNRISNIRRGTLTEYNPWFLLKNAVKDVQDVLINSQHPARTYAAIPKAIGQMARKGHWYQEYMDNGGDQNTYFDNETGTFAEENRALATAKKVFGLDAISKANNIVERLPRLAEYIASREAGQSVDVAMLDAARVTTNFAAGGDLTKMLNRNGFTFLNASVQGAVQQARNIREAKRNGLKGWAGLAARYIAAGIPTGLCALLLNGLIWDDDEEYAELSDYVKQNYYIVGKYGDGQFVRIPKGRAVAVIQNGFEQMGNLVTGNDEADLRTFLELVVENLAPSNPAENNLLAPIFDVMNNETWYGEDLVPTRLQDVPAAEQYDESTDAISRWLGEKLNYSPYKINYLLDQYSGVIGDTFLPMLTPEAENGTDSFGGDMIAPLADMFTTDSVMKNQNVSDFYDTVDELAVNANSSQATDEDVLKYKYINSVNADIGKLYQQKREIQSGDLPDAEKYEQVRDLQKQINEMARESLNAYGNVTIQDKYATVGDRHYRWYEPGEDSEAEPGWQKITDKQLAKQNEVTSGLGISPSEYWSEKEEYDYAYDYPGKYAVSQAVGGYSAYKTYNKELNDIESDKDKYGETISGSRKEKVVKYINNLNADYGEKIILYKSQYKGDDTYNYAIVEYLNSRDDLSYTDVETILTELGFTVYADGTITWD